MESLAFNIIARIDDVLFVDDATRRCAAAESMSVFGRGGGFNGLPIQKKMSPSPFSIQHTPYASPFATPTFCSSPPLPSSPRRSVTPHKSGQIRAPNHKFDKVVPSDLDKLWSYTGNLGSRRVSWDAPERDWSTEYQVRERENKSEMLNSGGFIFICSVYLLSIGIYLPVEVLTMLLALDKLGLYLSTAVVQFQCAWLC